MQELKEIGNIIRKTLEHIDMWSRHSENLILWTGMVESNYEHLIQGYTQKGKARSFWQVEPETAYDNIRNYICFRQPLERKVKEICELQKLPLDKKRLEWILTTNIAFAICMARIWYYRSTSDPIPSNMNDLAKYWKIYYNTQSGAGEVADFKLAARECINKLS